MHYSPPAPKARLGFSSRALCFLGRLTLYGAEPVHLQEGPPPSEQRQRSLFGSPLLPLHNIHSGKGRTTSERVTGVRTTHPSAPAHAPPNFTATNSMLRPNSPDSPSAPFTAASTAPSPSNQSPAWLLKPGCFVLPGAAYNLRSGAGAPTGRTPRPRSSDSGRSLGGLCYLYTIYIQAKGGQQASAETGGRTTPQVHRLMLPPTSQQPTRCSARTAQTLLVQPSSLPALPAPPP